MRAGLPKAARLILHPALLRDHLLDDIEHAALQLKHAARIQKTRHNPPLLEKKAPEIKGEKRVLHRR